MKFPNLVPVARCRWLNLSGAVSLVAYDAEPAVSEPDPAGPCRRGLNRVMA